MSPGIVTSPSSSPSPVSLLRVAISWARIESIPVGAADAPGVICVSRESRVPWRKDPTVGEVSPVGALVLLRQPRTAHIWAACAEVLGGSIPLAEGVQDGVAKTDRRPEKFGNAFRLYLEGYEAGTRVRMDLLTVVCEAHAVRHPRAEKCPGCAEEAIDAVEQTE